MGLKEDPLNVLTRVTLAMSLYCSGRVEDTQLEAEKILELQEGHPWASWLLAGSYARQKRWKEAYSVVEKASPVFPWIIGWKAGILKCMGETARAEALIHELMPGAGYDSPNGLAGYYYLCGEIDKVADCFETLIERRHPSAGQMALMSLRSSHRWSELAKLMNLKKPVCRQ